MQFNIYFIIKSELLNTFTPALHPKSDVFTPCLCDKGPVTVEYCPGVRTRRSMDTVLLPGVQSLSPAFTLSESIHEIVSFVLKRFSYLHYEVCSRCVSTTHNLQFLAKGFHSPGVSG